MTDERRLIMRKRHIYILGTLLLFTLFIAASCGGNGGNGGKETSDTTLLGDAGIVFNDDSASQILASYMKVKDALVESDAVKSADEANTLASLLANYKGCENTAIMAQELANSHDLAAQRAAFKSISKDLIGIYEHAPKASGTLYLQHCPMYDENKGGDWLSTSSAIRNPYYGDEMLTCGKVVREIE